MTRRTAFVSLGQYRTPDEQETYDLGTDLTVISHLPQWKLAASPAPHLFMLGLYVFFNQACVHSSFTDWPVQIPLNQITCIYSTLIHMLKPILSDGA